jgi:lipopolysaccharide export system protein LptC
MTLRQLLGGLVLAALAGLSVWLLERVEPVPEAARAPRTSPDYYLENFVASAMDEDGRLRERLRADMMYHYPHDESAELIRPRLEVYRNEEAPPWLIDAEHGWLYEGGELILLHGDVHMEREASPQTGPAMRLITREVRVRPAARYAETDEPVTMLRGDATRIEAVGMRAHLGDGWVELLSTVRGRHDPIIP